MARKRKFGISAFARKLPVKFGTQYALVSMNDEQYSANRSDYWASDLNHIFTDSKGEMMDLAEMEYDEDGDYKVKRIVKRGPVHVKDLPDLTAIGMR